MHIIHLTDWPNFLTMENWLSVLGCLFAGPFRAVGIDCECNGRAMQGYNRRCPSAESHWLSEQLFFLFFSQAKL